MRLHRPTGGAEAVLQQYPPSAFSDSTEDAFVAADSDFTCGCPLRSLADLMAHAYAPSFTSSSTSSSSSSPLVQVFEYRWRHLDLAGCDFAAIRHIIKPSLAPTQTPPAPVPTDTEHAPISRGAAGAEWASHASELLYFFGNTRASVDWGESGYCPKSAEEEGLSSTLMAYFGSFAHDGRPAASPLEPTWPPLSV